MSVGEILDHVVEIVDCKKTPISRGHQPPLEISRLDRNEGRHAWVAINDRRAGLTREPWTLGGPAPTLRWLTAHLAAWDLQLLRGQVILTGSALPLFPVKPGSQVVAEARPLGRSSVAIE